MDTRLRAWVNTGEYGDVPETQPGWGPLRHRRYRGAGRWHGALIAALVPVGIVMGALFAAAFLVRLLMLPLTLLADGAWQRGEPAGGREDS
jgi:hypothetical protein